MNENRQALKIEAIDPLHADAIFLLHQAAEEVRPMYYDSLDINANPPTNAPAVPGSIYLIARLAGNPIGSIALRPYQESIAEVCRMYVLPAYRRQRIARSLLDLVEASAIELGYNVLRLETGNRQLPAIALYEACGYQRISPFGKCKADPTSVCFEKILYPKKVL